MVVALISSFLFFAILVDSKNLKSLNNPVDLGLRDFNSVRLDSLDVRGPPILEILSREHLNIHGLKRIYHVWYNESTHCVEVWFGVKTLILESTVAFHHNDYVDFDITSTTKPFSGQYNICKRHAGNFGDGKIFIHNSEFLWANITTNITNNFTQSHFYSSVKQKYLDDTKLQFESQFASFFSLNMKFNSLVGHLFKLPSVPEPVLEKAAIFFEQIQDIFKNQTIFFNINQYNRRSHSHRHIMKETQFSNATLYFDIFEPLKDISFYDNRLCATYYASVKLTVVCNVTFDYNQTRIVTLVNLMNNSEVVPSISLFPGIDGQWQTGFVEMDVTPYIRPHRTEFSIEETERQNIFWSEGELHTILDINMKFGLREYLQRKTRNFTIDVSS